VRGIEEYRSLEDFEDIAACECERDFGAITACE
jgi:hypothetical protein